MQPLQEVQGGGNAAVPELRPDRVHARRRATASTCSCRGTWSHRLPDEVSFAAGVLVEPGSCVLRGIERCRLRPGETIGVIGIGTLGALALTLARLYAPGALVAYGVRAPRARVRNDTGGRCRCARDRGGRGHGNPKHRRRRARRSHRDRRRSRSSRARRLGSCVPAVVSYSSASPGRERRSSCRPTGSCSVTWTSSGAAHTRRQRGRALSSCSSTGSSTSIRSSPTAFRPHASPRHSTSWTTAADCRQGPPRARHLAAGPSETCCCSRLAAVRSIRSRIAPSAAAPSPWLIAPRDGRVLTDGVASNRQRPREARAEDGTKGHPEMCEKLVVAGVENQRVEPEVRREVLVAVVDGARHVGQRSLELSDLASGRPSWPPDEQPPARSLVGARTLRRRSRRRASPRAARRGRLDP